jgi:hypothetical protein
MRLDGRVVRYRTTEVVRIEQEGCELADRGPDLSTDQPPSFPF